MKVADNALEVLARTRAALGMANRRLVASRNCEADIRRRYANAR
jgi:hypothetical protein